MRDKIKKIIFDNSQEKIFGCSYCKEDSELCISSISVMADEQRLNGCGESCEAF